MKRRGFCPATRITRLPYFVGNDARSVISFGENKFLCSSSDIHARGTVHAERAAMDKLPSRSSTGSKHWKVVDMLVIRTSKTGVLGHSRPCLHCIEAMCVMLPERGYRIDRVHYSDEHGNLVTTKLAELARLAREGNFHVSNFYSHPNDERLKRRTSRVVS